MMIWEGIDKRKFPRVNYRCKIKLSDHGKKEVFETETENIGAGGLCVVLGKEFDLFKTAEVEIFLDEIDKVIKCKGAIVWVIRRRHTEDAETFNYDIGIEFTEISDKDKEIILDLVDDLVDI